MGEFISRLNTLIWSAPALILILSVGICLSVRLRFAQLTLFPAALRRFMRQFFRGRNDSGSQSSFRSLCTALSATVGTGNLVGVAGAICLGGPGSVFWMWICGILGMATKYTEALLAVRYRIKSEKGYCGGTMYMILQGLPGTFHFLAWLYALFGMIASFGVGNAAQINAAITGIRACCRTYGLELPPVALLAITATVAFLVGVILFGGAGSVAAMAERLIPFAALGYILLCGGVLLVGWKRIPWAFSCIFRGAFSPGAVTGGAVGSTFLTLRIGCSRGVFTNEAGMGTAAIAHGEAAGVHPAEQGLMGIIEVFLDTIVICTLTALVILVSGVPVSYGTDQGGLLTTAAFSRIYGSSAVLLLTAAMTLFAFATILGWGLYGGRCAQFLFGPGAWQYFAALQIPAVFAGAFLETTILWQFSEAVNGLMAIPNLITLAVLAPEAVRLTKEYKNPVHGTGGGNYADFHQCKPL